MRKLVVTEFISLDGVLKTIEEISSPGTNRRVRNDKRVGRLFNQRGAFQHTDLLLGPISKQADIDASKHPQRDEHQ